MRESDLLNWIFTQTSGAAGVRVGPGDDCAVMDVGGEALLVTVDQVLEEVHVRLAEDGAFAAGRKALARNLSDIAAMGGRAIGAVASVALPRGCDESMGQEIYRGLRSIGDEFSCPVIGGDVAAWDQRLCVSVTVLGLASTAGPILRSGGRAGDVLLVTGSLGGAWRGRRHLEFTPRIREGRVLAEQYGATAMIDLSDGLATDLNHLCRLSELGARVDAAAVPIAPDITGDPLKAALTDGEDYELLVAMDPTDADRLLSESPFDVPVSRIGTLTEAREVLLIDRGESRPLKPEGWEHSTE
ncbi:MAG: thiamine-phosphate kinase [Phycisphaerae bacterium]